MGNFLLTSDYAKQFFEGIETPVDIPLEDDFAYTFYPKYNWVYNKLELCNAVGIEAQPHGVKPKKFPIFSKPIINLYGMSNGAKKFYKWSDDDYIPGHFYMPYLTGRHISTDVAVVKGNISWSYFLEGIKGKNDVFLYWRLINEIPFITRQNIFCFIKKHLKDYTGFLNFETIGNDIIECHLRANIEIVDLIGGKEWVKSLVILYSKGFWNFTYKPTNGYSVVLRTEKTNKKYSINNKDKKLALKYVSSIQITADDYLNNDEYTIKLASINGFNYNNCLEAKKILKRGFDISSEYLKR